MKTPKGEDANRTQKRQKPSPDTLGSRGHKRKSSVKITRSPFSALRV